MRGPSGSPGLTDTSDFSSATELRSSTCDMLRPLSASFIRMAPATKGIVRGPAQLGGRDPGQLRSCPEREGRAVGETVEARALRSALGPADHIVSAVAQHRANKNVSGEAASVNASLQRRQVFRRFGCGA